MTNARQGPAQDTPNVSIVEHDSAKNPLRRVTLHNAWASDIESGPAIEKVTLTYEDLTID
ncbi:hypothetical protein AB0I10_25105 [Streptomyces sp. NPDC050636]|uniref:hypothetical protein n=1 Tax=Streptomyces sp. NPDC050636 TaxID=3154510 RepID=UPI00341CEB03